MFDHVTIRVGDRPRSEAMYARVLATLGVELTISGSEFAEWDDFSLAQAGDADQATSGLHLGFVAPSRAHVDAFWRAGLDAGFADDGAPGPRPQYRDDYYGGFLRDPDGNSAEAVHHGALRAGGDIDHLWVRVADVAESRRFYETIAAHAGFRLASDEGDRVHFAGETGSFSIVAGEPTRHLHLAFGAGEEAVRAFHRAGVEAGYADNGPPGERPEYHPGYYAAFLLDPDGNNVELVDHHR